MFLRIYNFFINTNIYISTAAVLLTLETQVQLGMRPQFHPYLLLLFFATLFDYNLHRFITVLANKQALNSDKHKWVQKHLVFFYALVAFSLAGFLCAVFYADFKVLVTLAPIAVVTIFYSLPVYKNKNTIFRLREISYLKIFLISFVWAAATILLPIIQSGISFNKEHIFIMLTERFLFIFAIAIPFDIRDMEADMEDKLKTIPLLIGKKNSLILANVTLVLFTIVFLAHHQPHRDLWFINLALALSAVTSFFFLNNKKLQSKHFYYSGILDGTLLLQGVLVLICYYLQNILK